MRKKSLTPDQNGQIWVNIGWKLTKSGKRSKAKICLGDSLKDAERRLARLEKFWEDIEKKSKAPLWDEFTFEIAKSLAKGELQFVIERQAGEETDDYAQRSNLLSLKYPSVKFVAGDDDAYEDGQEKITDYAEAAISGFKDMYGLTGHVGVASSGTLHQAMDSYVEWIKKDYFDIEEQHVNENGMTKIKQVVSLREFLPDVPLSELGYQGVDDLFGTLRRRPVSKRTGTPLKATTCKNYLGELKRFLEWLDMSDDSEWLMPHKFARIKRQPIELESDIAAEAREIFTFSVEHFRTLYRYASPLDRLFIILGLNCAYGVDQTGRLKLDEIMLHEDPPQIGRIRRKKKVFGQHRLWNHTCVLLRWALDRREEFKNGQSREFLLLKRSGVPFW